MFVTHSPILVTILVNTKPQVRSNLTNLFNQLCV